MDRGGMILPRLYAIVDVGTLTARGLELPAYAKELRAAGVGMVQLRDKTGSPQEVLRAAAILKDVFVGTNCLLVMNDRADLSALAGFDGVHVGQGDLSGADARRVLERVNPISIPMELGSRWGTRSLVGISTHTEEQVRDAELSDADYMAVGPVFATGTKADASPVVGLEGVRRARSLTTKPLVAIGGITRENCRSVVDAGADSVAVISGLIVAGESVEAVARDFLRILG